MRLISLLASKLKHNGKHKIDKLGDDKGAIEYGQERWRYHRP
jgi:hypothetical protein